MSMRFGLKTLAARLLAATCLVAPALMGAAGSAMAAPAESIPAATAQRPVPPVIPAHIERLFPDAARQCGPLTGNAPSPATGQRIETFKRAVSLSQTGRDLLAAAADYKDGKPAWMCFSEMRGNHAVYYTGQGVLGVGLNKSADEIVGDALHELRHLFQEKAGLFSIDPASRADRVHVEYAGEADAEATTSLVLWELKQAGMAQPWQRHNDHRNYGPRSICYAHISTSFKQAVENGAAPAVAAQHAFRAWYRDRDLLGHYKDAVMEGIGRVHDTLYSGPDIRGGYNDNALKPLPAPLSAPAPLPKPAPSRCDAPDTERGNRHYELPSDDIAQLIDNSVGQLPSYRVNFVQQGGGLKAILQAP